MADAVLEIKPPSEATGPVPGIVVAVPEKEPAEPSDAAAPADDVVSKAEEDSGIEFVYLLDAMTRNLKFPYSRAQHHREMHCFVAEAFKGVDKLESQVACARYDLMDYSNNIILPSAWEDVVYPGIKVKMAMRPSPMVHRPRPPGMLGNSNEQPFPPPPGTLGRPGPGGPPSFPRPVPRPGQFVPPGPPKPVPPVFPPPAGPSASLPKFASRPPRPPVLPGASKKRRTQRRVRKDWARRRERRRRLPYGDRSWDESSSSDSDDSESSSDDSSEDSEFDFSADEDNCWTNREAISDGVLISAPAKSENIDDCELPFRPRPVAGVDARLYSEAFVHSFDRSDALDFSTLTLIPVGEERKGIPDVMSWVHVKREKLDLAELQDVAASQFPRHGHIQQALHRLFKSLFKKADDGQRIPPGTFLQSETTTRSLVVASRAVFISVPYLHMKPFARKAADDERVTVDQMLHEAFDQSAASRLKDERQHVRSQGRNAKGDVLWTGQTWMMLLSPIPDDSDERWTGKDRVLITYGDQTREELMGPACDIVQERRWEDQPTKIVRFLDDSGVLSVPLASCATREEAMSAFIDERVSCGGRPEPLKLSYCISAFGETISRASWHTVLESRPILTVVSRRQYEGPISPSDPGEEEDSAESDSQSGDSDDSEFFVLDSTSEACEDGGYGHRSIDRGRYTRPVDVSFLALQVMYNIVKRSIYKGKNVRELYDLMCFTQRGNFLENPSRREMSRTAMLAFEMERVCEVLRWQMEMFDLFKALVATRALIGVSSCPYYLCQDIPQVQHGAIKKIRSRLDEDRAYLRNLTKSCRSLIEADAMAFLAAVGREEPKSTGAVLALGALALLVASTAVGISLGGSGGDAGGAQVWATLMPVMIVVFAFSLAYSYRDALGEKLQDWLDSASRRRSVFSGSIHPEQREVFRVLGTKVRMDEQGLMTEKTRLLDV